MLVLVLVDRMLKPSNQSYEQVILLLHSESLEDNLARKVIVESAVVYLEEFQGDMVAIINDSVTAYSRELHQKLRFR